VPEAVSVTYRDFCEIAHRLRRRGFREISFSEEPSYEIGFVSIPRHGYAVKVWTTCEREKVERCSQLPLLSSDIVVGRPRYEDAGRVLIVSARDGREEYFAADVHRTKNFVENFLKRIWVTWLRIVRPPCCPRCNARMKIMRRRINGKTWWGCLNKEGHLPDKKPVWARWDIMLSDEVLALVKESRRSRNRYRKAERAAGREPQRKWMRGKKSERS